MKPIRSLYVHIPFCERKCEYCDFTSVAGLRGEHAYMRALAQEIRMLGALFPEAQLETVFVGGGTPSLVEPQLLELVMDAVRSSFPLAACAEVTLEANPSSTTVERARRWLASGFNRVSIGVQSLEDDVLRFLGRVHDASAATAAVASVREAGFEAVSCDLIYGVPGLDDQRWRTTLQRVLEAGPGHVSCYELTVEEGTPLHRSVRLGHVTPVAGELALRQHALAREMLQRAGLMQYEVSNFARPGSESRHNLAYWHNDFYLAAGVGAHGHVPAPAAPRLGLHPEGGAAAVRYWHGRGIAAYGDGIAGGRLPIAGWEAITARERMEETVMLGLRLREGVALQAPDLVREAQVLHDAGFLVLEGGRIRVTARGEEVLNSVVAQLVASAA